MALSDDQILAQNTWWSNPDWRAVDPHLTLLGRQPKRFPADFVMGLDLDREGIHSLRGPRQVGKTTDLKLLVERAIESGREPRSVVYLTFDLIEGQPHAALAETVARAKTLARYTGSSLILLDEVTALSRWQTAVKALWDDGSIRGDVVVCTGSSAIDLQRGAAERLPGRRGGGRDHLALPRSFAEFARAVDPSIPASPELTVAQIVAPAGQETLLDARVHGPALADALDRYLSFGGLPVAVAEAVAGAPAPSEEAKRVLYDSLVREVQRRGAGIPATHALLERVLRSLGSKTSWSQMAKEMAVPLGRRGGAASHQTLRDYIELLAGGYFLFIAYFWKADMGTNNLSKDKKVFFADPLLHTIAREHVPGFPADIPALIENVVGFALYRRYEPPGRLIETFNAPERLHIWQTAKGGEVDFVAGSRGALEPVEVKYRSHIDRRGPAAIARAHPGRPVVVASKDDLCFTDAYSLVPAHLLLWALG